MFGLVLPQSVIPSISGPVLGTNGLSNVWGSATGVLVSWEPFDFGLRRAHTEAAQSVTRRAQADVDLTRLEVQVPPPMPSSRSWPPSRICPPHKPAWNELASSSR